jgi:hypothetical protein
MVVMVSRGRHTPGATNESLLTKAHRTRAPAMAIKCLDLSATQYNRSSLSGSIVAQKGRSPVLSPGRASSDDAAAKILFKIRS